MDANRINILFEPAARDRDRCIKKQTNVVDLLSSRKICVTFRHMHAYTTALGPAQLIRL